MTEPLTAEPWHSFVMPARIETTRLVLRCYEPTDAPPLKAAIDKNLDHLLPWIPWAVNEPSPLDVIEQRLVGFAKTFSTGPDWAFGIFRRHDSTLIGGIGFHGRIGPRALEVGYWLDAQSTRHGYMTEAAAALTKVAFGFHEIDRLEIRCDPKNAPSAAVPRRLGYRHAATLEKNGTLPSGEPRATMVWEMTRDDFVGSIAEAPAVRVPPEINGRELLRHTLATLAYRGGKALRDVPQEFSSYCIAPSTRTPGEILAHIADLLDWAGWLMRGEHRWSSSQPGEWDADVARFFAGLQLLDDYLASDAPLHRSAGELFQGPIADALTHVGQIAMLRRLAGYPVRAENYAKADIVRGRVGPAQAAPRMEFD